MTPLVLWNNLVAYSAQVALLVAAAGISAWLFRISVARARLLWWHSVLLACLLLPLVQPWERRAYTFQPLVVTGKATPRQLPPPADSISWDPAMLGLGAFAFGTAIRLAWLGLGLVRLRRHRRGAKFLDPIPDGLADLCNALAPDARLCLSDAVVSPVTFGTRKPVVLLPAEFPELNDRAQRAIVCHELLHIARHDWLYVLAEEIVRALMWFHPAIWWLLGQVQLSREQTVDGEVVSITNSRHEYLDALLTIAGGKPQPDLAPAPLFLRRRHLKKRVVSILKEASMSKFQLTASMAASAAVLLAVGWIAMGTFPLAAAPQAVTDGDGISLDTGAAAIAHRIPVNYPEGARAKGIQGTVVVEATVASDGNVSDARVLTGPEELRRAALEAVLQIHFARSAGSGVKQVSIAFALPKGAPVPTQIIRVVPRSLPQSADAANSLTVKGLNIVGLSPAAEQELRAQLPVSEGRALSPDDWRRLNEAVKAYDEHLLLSLQQSSPSDATVTIMAPGARRTAGQIAAMVGAASGATDPARANSSGTAMPARIRVGGNVQQQKRLSIVAPVYPPLAKQARIQGVVAFEAVIDREGHVQNLMVLSGHPLLVPAALEAVKQWTYQTTFLNGNPVEVVTQIDVNFTLAAEGGQ